MSPLFLFLATSGPVSAQVASVELDGARYLELRTRATDPGPLAPAAAAGVVRRDLTLWPSADGVRFEGTWTVTSTTPAWVEGGLTAPGAHVEVDGDWAVDVGPSGVRVGRWVDGSATLTAHGWIPGDAIRGPVAVGLLGAAAGATTVVTDQHADVTGAALLADGRWSGGGALTVHVRPATTRGPRQTLALAEVGLGVTVGDAEIRGRGRLRWTIRQGALEAVSFAVQGVGADLDVTGPQVADWSRSGDRVQVELREAEDARVDLALSWTTPTPQGAEGRVPVPRILPDGALRTEGGVQLARMDEIEVVPSLSGVEAVASAALPEVARDLVEGTPTAAFRSTGPVDGDLGLLRFVPVSGPPTLVDVAAWTLATTDDGRVLGRGLLQVRNDRGAHLRVRPPAGHRLIGARVAGETARIARDGEVWLVPLARSVETVEGLLSFPVEILVLGETDGWARREDRKLLLPTVDADVAVTRVTVHLPPGRESRLKTGDDGIVASFSEGEGITYGLGHGDARAAEADARFQEAVSAWMRNDFAVAQEQLDQLAELGASNENVERLQSNLDALDGDDSGGDEGLKRRIKEQAQARAEEDRLAVEEEEKKAEEAYLAGRYAEAEATYKKALEKGRKLAKLEDEEEVEQREANVVIEGKLKKAREAKKNEAAVRPTPDDSRDQFLDDDGLPDVIEGAITKPVVTTVVSGEVIDTDAVEDSRSEVLTKDFLERIPSGRSYQTATQLAQGVTGGGGNPNLAGAAANEPAPEPEPEPIVAAAANENTYLLDGANITAGAATNAEPPPPPIEEIMPVSSDEIAVSSRSRRGRGADRKAKPAPAAPGAKTPDRPAVVATTVSVVVPTLGDAVLYQHLLLPADAPLALRVAARPTRGGSR